MATEVFRRTRCEGCGKIQEHKVNFPYGWGKASVNYYDHSDSVSSQLVHVVLCHECLNAVSRAVFTTLEQRRIP